MPLDRPPNPLDFRNVYPHPNDHSPLLKFAPDSEMIPNNRPSMLD